MKTFEFEKQGIKFYVEIDIKNKLTFGDKLATEHIKKLARALSQIPRVVEFLQSGDNEAWEELRQAGWGWIPPRDYENSHLDPDGLCWYFLGDYVGVTVEA